MKIFSQKSVFATLCLFCFGIAFIPIARAEKQVLIAPDSTTVTIERDNYGVPHIQGESETGVFFAQGFAIAQDRLYQLELFRHAGQGRLAEMAGSGYVDSDKWIRNVFYTEAERREIFNSLSENFQNMLEAYSAGINTYIDSMNANPAKYKPQQFFFMVMKPWEVTHSIAIMQFMIRNFGQFGGEELDRLKELQEHGQEWFNQNRPINDPSAPTTIPASTTGSVRSWHYSGITVQPEIIKQMDAEKENYRKQAKALGIPLKLGSFAVLISGQKSNSGNVMLLGCPQMGTPRQNETQIANEVELQSPEFHVGGMTLAGIPGVIIGHNEHHAWTLTSGVSDNSDIFIETTMDTTYSKYRFKDEWLDFSVYQDTIYQFAKPIPFTHYRTIHGPVVGADLAHKQVYSLKMTFWKEELDMMKAIFGIFKASTLQEVESFAAMLPMSFNLFYAGKDQTIKFWHVGKYQDRGDGVDPRLPHKGDGTEEWQGFIDFKDLPHAENPAQGYFVNWNNKPVAWWNNGDNIAWGMDSGFTNRVKKIDNFVGPIQGFTFENLQDVPRQINDHGTYQQAIELSTTEIIGKNVLPPGQSGFISLTGEKSPHFDDQWSLHANWQFKDMLFGQNISSAAQSANQIPKTFVLFQNYPNPFNPVTIIKYQLPQASHVLLQVYDLRGRLLKTLVRGQKSAGEHQFEWDARHLSSGLYFIRIQADNFVASRKAILLK